MRRIDLALGASVLVFLAGIVRDLQWHATHDTQREFETASKQVEVHAILWVGALAILTVCALAFRRGQTRSTAGYRVTLASAVAYAGISVWHFIEHANGNDPELAHLFLYASSLAMVSGAFLALRRALDHRRSLARG
jgi:hypothetical protein